MPMTDEVEELLHVLGPFYELIDEKKKITQISDLGTGKPKRKSSTRRHKVSLQNGKLSNGGSHVANGSHPRADESQEVSAGEPLLNGHHAGQFKPSKINRASIHLFDLHNNSFVFYVLDARTNPVTSDSDSEVYCDSVDQFGQEEARQTLRNMILDHILLITPLKVSFFAQSSEHNRSLDDLEEDVLLVEENVQDPPQAVRCGGEEGETGGTVSQRPRLNVDMPGSSLARRAQGEEEPTGHLDVSLSPPCLTPVMGF
ncbi:hypothetical protein GOODEAATRI_006833 [Goodea atripinnis]|uniref:Uncharacterized protein n=1 Tax=Goodea atripinnis TaxID=208336 RepID=A0ABV0N2G6_9TELE